MEVEEGKSLIVLDQSDLVPGQPVTKRKRLGGGELWGWDLAQVQECLPTTHEALGFILWTV